ncbi:MAG: gliding motility-associated C-terminal domain-containing protein [Saprospiraceae bacterium]|nr:gliding motility-associated C-terminal domain-containing protein [Saprospiraceae bacterium]
MKKILFSLLAFSLVVSLQTIQGQATILMKNGKDSLLTCGGLFLDAGNNGAYANNQTLTLTLSSSDPESSHIALGFDLLDLAPGDELCFFDGPTVNDSLIGCASDLVAAQNTIVETTARSNGKMTIRFRSNNDNIQRQGWVARILCIPSCQTLRAKVTAIPFITPQDTGWIDGCPNTTRVSFKATGIYPFNDIKYHQSDTLSKFEWNFGDGSPIVTGPEVDHVFTESGGFNVKVIVTDTMGCQNVNFIKQRVRISPRPTFNTGMLVTEVCTGTEIKLRGQSQLIDPNFQVSTQPNSGSFPIGQVRSETLFIPDNPAKEYRTSVYFTDFGPGQTLTNIADLTRIFVNMEHSYARDLEIKILCPSRRSVTLHQYDFPTRDRNRILIGQPLYSENDCRVTTSCVDDGTRNPPGKGLEYAWVNTGAAGTWRGRFTASGTHSLPAGKYRSDQALSGLVGCPLNGEWTIVVKDQFGGDNGWIFQWGIEFKKDLYPSIETFQRRIVDHYWKPSTNITSYMRDSIVSKPKNAGIASFAYEVVDDAGCKFDTIVNVSVLPPTHPTCRTCTPDFLKLRDTSICTTDAGILMNKTPRTAPNNSIVFETFPYKQIDAISAPITKPDTCAILVRNLFQNTMTSPLTQIDSVCFDIGSRASDDIFVQLLAPNNAKIPLMNTQRGGFAFPLRTVCFSPTATRSIATATAPISGLYQPENGLASWNVFNGSPINGTWKLLVADARGAEKDTINQWSITFKTGNANTYNWSPAMGLSSVNAATTIAKPTTTTRYIVNIVDSINCVHRDTVNLTVLDSFVRPAIRTGTVRFNSIQVVWPAITGATGYEISIDNGLFITPNGNLSHTVTGLRPEQTVDFRIRAVGGRCGARLANFSATSLACVATIGKGVNRRIEVDSVLCNGSASPLINFRYATGEAPFTYFIDTFRQTNSGVFLDKIKAGAHRAIFIDGTGCSDTLDFNFGQPDSINIRVLVDSVKCNGDRTGKLTAIASGGTGELTYALNLSPIRRNIGIFDSLPVGRYSVEVEDANRCRKSISTDIFQPTPLTLNLAKIDVTCFGKTTGTVRANVAGGIFSYTYNWRSGETTDRLSNLGIGSYFVTITDRNGCTRLDSTTLTSNTKIQITTLQDSVKCYGEASGQARGRTTGGRAPYVYNWNNTQFDSIAIRLRAGLHRLTVSDALGCSDTASVVVLQPDSLRFDSLVAVPSACSNTASGAARVTISGGTQSYRYAWSSSVAATTPSVSNLAIGNYSVTVRDFNNCSKTENFTIGSPTAVVLDRFNEIKVKCNGDASGGLSANASGGVGGYTFRWGTTPVQTSDTAKNIRAGMYQVTISDRNNCQIIKDTTIGEPTKLVANITQVQNVKCRGEANGIATPSVFGGTGFAGNNRYLFQWNDPLNQNTLIADSLAAGAYIVTVTDANGCTDTANVTVAQPALIVTSTTTQTRLACFGQNTGEGKVIPSGGSGSYTYRWSNLQSSATVTNLAKGKYFVTVTDINGCTAKDSLDAFTRDSIAATITLTQPTCFNSSTGSAAITSVSGGAGNNNLTNYFYRWSTSPVQSTPQATNIPGNRQYSVTITDSENCSNIAYMFLTQPGPINLSSVIRPVSCYGGGDGEAQINAFGSINVFTYVWNDANGQTTQRATQLTAGLYSVIVRDSAGCSKDTTVNITQPSRLKMDIRNIVDNKCVGDSTGSVEISFSGGVPNYNYLWSNGVSTQSQSKLRSGTYILTVSDANGCKFNDTIIIKSPNPVDADVTTMPVQCFGDRNGVITVNAFGGTTPYLYSLDGKNFNGISQIVGLKSNNYDVYVKDANGCIWFTKEEVKTPPKFMVEATADVSINLGDKLQLFANPQNARGRVNLTWKQPYDSTLTCLKCANPTAFPKSTITYSVIGIDSVGCRATDSVKITVEKPRNIYVPTGFTPNSDNINDKLIVHGRKGTKINLFRIYDRWGELVYEARGFDINDENAGWNGTFRGEEMMSGQFVWYIEATYFDGAEERLKGHTTLIR